MTAASVIAKIMCVFIVVPAFAILIGFVLFSYFIVI